MRSSSDRGSADATERTPREGGRAHGEEEVMPSPVKPIPDGYHAITPYLSIKGAAAAIEFDKKAFGAIEVLRMPRPDGRIGHAELTLGDSRIMLADEHPEIDFRGPQSLGGTPVHLHLYVPDVDAVVERAPGRRRPAGPPGAGPVLRRPARHGGGPVRPRVERRDAHGRPLDGG